MSINKSLYTSNYEEWETPKELFYKLDQEFNFNIDLCANDNNYLCEEYYTKEKSCLEANISNKNIYCNPPYGRTISKFIEYCDYLNKEKNCLVVMLLPARTDTKYFHKYIYNKKNIEIRFIQGRLHFSRSKNSAPFPSMIVIFRRKND